MRTRRTVFPVARFFFKLVWQNGEDKKNDTNALELYLDWLNEEFKQKNTRRSKCAWILLEWVSMSSTFHRIGPIRWKSLFQIAVIVVKFPKFYRTFLFSWHDLNRPFEPTARASFVRPAFASSLINAVLAFSNFSTMFSVVHVYLSTYTKTAWLLEQH